MLPYVTVLAPSLSLTKQQVTSNTNRLHPHLRLSNNRIETLPDSLCDLTQLTKLELDGNQIRALPVRLGDLATLTRLELRDNKLESLPDSIAQLILLTQLNCSNNSLTELPATVSTMLRVEELRADSNRLTALPDLSRLTSLTVFDVGQNHLSSIPNMFAKCKRLAYFDVACNDLVDLPWSLGRIKSLEQIEVKGNPRLRVSRGRTPKLSVDPLQPTAGVLLIYSVCYFSGAGRG